MSKTLELVLILFLLLFSFIAGVVYSPSVRSNFEWLFEVKEQELDVSPSTTNSNDNIQNSQEEKEVVPASVAVPAVEKKPDTAISNENPEKVTTETNIEELPAN